MTEEHEDLSLVPEVAPPEVDPPEVAPPEVAPPVVPQEWSWRHMKASLHPSLQLIAREGQWLNLDDALDDVFDGWDYAGEVDLSKCETWKCVCECLWKHKGVEFSDEIGHRHCIF